MKEENRKPEMEVLFPDMVVEGYKVKPWTWNQLIGVLPIFSGMIDDIEASGLEIDDLDPTNPKKLLKCLGLLGPYAPDVVAKTLGIERSEVDSWEGAKIMNIFIVVLVQNAHRLKNSLSLGMSQLGSILNPGPLPKQ
jgi:hypothetical protein